MVALIFFFNDTATTEIYTLSLHDALPISFNADLPHGFNTTNVHFHGGTSARAASLTMCCARWSPARVMISRSRSRPITLDRKSTRLNSSHANISYAVFCLKKKKQK